VPPQVDLRQDGFPVRSHGARIMLLREKMDLLREAQWTEHGHRERAEDILNSLLAKTTTRPDARTRPESDERVGRQTWLVHPDLFRVFVRCRTASAAALA